MNIMNNAIRNATRKVSTALILTMLAMPLLFGQGPAALNIDLARTKAPVSPTLYGLMTEEINYSYDGGLYAELVRNRTFRSDWSGILNWYLFTKADANSRAGLLDEGYWGIAVRPNTRYTGSFYAKSDSANALPVRIAIVEDQSGRVLASANT